VLIDYRESQNVPGRNQVRVRRVDSMEAMRLALARRVASSEGGRVSWGVREGRRGTYKLREPH
jgi:hypothetical protein